MPLSIILIESGYGGMFATAPQVLLSQYGNKPLSIVHGALLLSWGLASLFSFFAVWALLLAFSSFSYLPWLLSIMYLCMCALAVSIKKSYVNITV